MLRSLKTFFDLGNKNFVIELFSNKNYLMFVIIPKVLVYKSQQNILMIEISIEGNLFNYLYLLLFSNVF